MSKIKNGLNALLESANKSAKNRACIGSTVGSSWRYVDFIDVSKNRPCLPLEYLYGSRGFITGRIVKLDAGKSAGKSSSMFMAYGMAQKAGGCWSVHYDTEDAPPPADFMAHLGCDPSEVFIEHPEDLDSFFKSLEKKTEDIRKDLDPEKEYPIFFGLDSVSGIGVDQEKDGSNKKKKDSNNSGQVSYHSRQFSKWFREKLKILSKNDAVLMASGQLKENIGAGMFASQEEQQSTLAGKTFGFHATWVMRMNHSPWRDLKTKTNLGEVITCRCLKNKVNVPHRYVKIHLRSTDNPDEEARAGWDFDQATIDLLSGKFGNEPPFESGEFKNSGAYYYLDGLNAGKGLMKKDFVDAFLADEELVMRAREAMRVRGFGFKFETNFKSFDQIEEEEENA